VHVGVPRQFQQSFSRVPTGHSSTGARESVSSKLKKCPSFIDLSRSELCLSILVHYSSCDIFRACTYSSPCCVLRSTYPSHTLLSSVSLAYSNKSLNTQMAISCFSILSLPIPIPPLQSSLLRYYFVQLHHNYSIEPWACVSWACVSWACVSWACILLGRASRGICISQGMHLVGVYLMGAYFMGMHPRSVPLSRAFPAGVHVKTSMS
jgi:hypothetical protein